ncbi:hypothetical protein [Bacteroides acidifaciens]|uniref:hypothetical protein n=1 Tax=Bacteroides acidifaciens TaxID=85831 RepID=UPI00301436A6
MAFNEQEEAKVRELLAAFENGKRINELDPAEGEPGAMRIEVMDASGETRSMELERAVAEAGNPIAGRWWDNTAATPTAGGWFGSLDFLKRLPETLGLGRYLVTDDRQLHKLDPRDSTRFADGSPAALDGSMGQCMWCWSRAWYFTEIVTAARTYWAITLKPLEGYKSVKIPVGGTSWLGAGVMDRTEMKLCSVISQDERYRGGTGVALTLATSAKRPALDTPQATMLGMPATNISTTNFGIYARKRGEGWEANWFVAQAAAQILLAVIMGTRNLQAPYNAEKDADGLYQGGFGTGVTDMPDWSGYNSTYPVIPTSVGLEMGDGTGLVDYALPASEAAENQETPYKTFKVPVFFGLVHAGFGHLWRWTRGLTVSQEAGVKTEVYVAKSMYADFNPNSVEGLLKVAECPQKEGYIKRVSTNGLCMMPTEVGGSASTYYADYFYTNGASQTGLRVRAAGGSAYIGTIAGAFATLASHAATVASTYYSSPLCVFVDDPEID